MWKTVLVSSQDQYNKTRMSVNKLKKDCFVSVLGPQCFHLLVFCFGHIRQWQMAIKQLNFEPACNLKTPLSTQSSSDPPSCFLTKLFDYNQTPPLTIDCFLKVKRTSCECSPSSTCKSPENATDDIMLVTKNVEVRSLLLSLV